jgi:hypothetical protein
LVLFMRRMNSWIAKRNSLLRHVKVKMLMLRK